MSSIDEDTINIILLIGAIVIEDVEPIDLTMLANHDQFSIFMCNKAIMIKISHIIFIIVEEVADREESES